LNATPDAELSEDAQDMLARWRVRSALLALLPLAALGTYGWRVEFFASPTWWNLAPWITVGAGALGTAFCYRVIFRGRIRPESYGRAAASGALPVFGPPIICMLLGWCILTRALPDLYTRVAGESVEVTAVLEKKSVRLARLACGKRITGAPFESGSLRNYYCANTREWLVVEDFRRVRIIERESWFGKHVERIEPDPAFQH
jgi:hypothetical protein